MICVLGATGNVGSELVDALCRRKEPVRVVTREIDRASRWAARVEVVVGDLREAGVRARALEGVARLFSFPFIEEPRLHEAILEEAKRARVRRVVMLSSIGAASSVPLGRLHREREEAVERTGLPWTFLRPSYFMSNALRWAPAIREQGRVVLPAPDGRFDAIAPADIAAVAELALLGSGHEAKTYVLTGAELLTARQQIETLSRVLERPIACVEVSIESAAEGLRKMGRPDWLVESLVTMWTSLRDGAADMRNDTFRTLMGRPPQSFETWARAHRDAFV